MRHCHGYIVTAVWVPSVCVIMRTFISPQSLKLVPTRDQQDTARPFVPPNVLSTGLIPMWMLSTMASYETFVAFALANLALFLLLLRICGANVAKAPNPAAHGIESQHPEPESAEFHGFLHLILDGGKKSLAGYSYLVSGPQIIERAYNRVRTPRAFLFFFFSLGS